MMENAVRQNSETEYIVKSQSGNGEYKVSKTYKGWLCTCPDYSFRGLLCKHIFAVKFSDKMRQAVKRNLVLEPVSVSQCQFCGSSKLRRYGIRRNKSGDLQRFLCEYCKRTFSINLAFEHMRHNPQAVTTAMQLYFSGESLRNTMKSLKLLGFQVSHVTVYNWIQKYVSLMKSYADKIQPNVSDVWRTDEIYIKMSGNKKWLFSVMDDQTRFWIAQQVADHKGTSDIQAMFQEAKRISPIEPSKIISDAAVNFNLAIHDEFAGKTKMPFTHQAEIRLAGQVHNNKMERMNGEIRDREKTMRGLKTTETPILPGMQIFHNYIRPHESLKGKTPAQAAGIEIKGDNKWLTFIQNAKVNEPKKRANRSSLDYFATGN